MFVPGFRFSGVAAGLKKHGGLDLGLILADTPAVAAGVFTRNLVRAAPVQLGERRVLQGPVRAILVNSGNANAFTGEAGMDAALRTTRALGALLGCSEEAILPSSTGVIGQVLPAEKVEAALPLLIANADPNRLEHFADAIMTTDRFRKISEQSLATASGQISFVGVCKGAGMIHPDLGGAGKLPQPPGPPHATMLAYALTDVCAEREQLQTCLEEAIDVTFNTVSVDGDTSTNDTVLLLASGVSGVTLDSKRLTEALIELLRPLARAMVQDGEGAEHVVDIRVKGLPTREEARLVARSIATSPLVKTAFAGKDANWGRLMMAAGKSGVLFDPGRATISIDGVILCQDGKGQGPEQDVEACKRMRKASFEILVDLGQGSAEFTYTTCDMGHAYIDVNAGYRS